MSGHASSSDKRDVRGARLRYYNPNAPRKSFGPFDEVIEYGPSVDMKTILTVVTEPHAVTVHDARTMKKGGLFRSWSLEENGFCFVPAPAPVKDFSDAKSVRAEWEPRLVEQVLRLTGASRVIWMGHMRRTKEVGYSRHSHTDFGPEFESLFRQMLVHRCKLSEAERPPE